MQQEPSSTNLLLQGHESEILTLRYNNSSNLLASAGMDRNILLWSPQKHYENISVLKSHTNAVTCLNFSYTDKLVSGSADKNISIWDVEMEKLLRKHKGHTGIVHTVSCPKKSASSQIIASAGDDNSVRIWDMRTKGELCIFQLKYPMTASCFSLDGNRLFVGGIDNQIKIFDIKLQRQIEGENEEQDIQKPQILKGHQDTISSLQISNDGNYLMSNSFDETIRIWDARPQPKTNNASEQRFCKTLMGHIQGNEKALLKGAWTHDGLYVACGSVDKCVYIWDTTTRKIVQKLGGHTGTVNQVTIGFYDGKSYMASGSNDKNIMVSELPDTFM